ncbi:MAG: hypothetical protein PHN55_05800 [Dysgonamonadaceae bacterium]|nr:hypothetical protein [Dysgonamonadaceae bacterium]
MILNFLSLLFLMNILVVNASDDKIIAKWNFQNGKIEESNQRFTGKLRGETILGKDHQGNSALILTASKMSDPNGLHMSEVYKELTPSGAFSLEVKFRINPKTQKQQMVLWDNKYIISPKPENKDKSSHSGFSLLLAKRGEKWEPRSYNGYGNSSMIFYGEPEELNDGEYHTLRLEYSPLEIRFLIDGELNYREIMVTPNSLSPAVNPTVIGDRVGPNYNGFDGTIAEVTLMERPAKDIIISQGGRAGFIRLESNPEFLVRIDNQSGKALSDLKVSAEIREFPEMPLPEHTINLEKGMTEILKFPMNAKLKPGVYHFDIKANDVTETIAVRLAPERVNSYPVVMWGNGNNKKLSDIGFTHAINSLSILNPDPTDLGKTLNGLNKIDMALSDNIYHLDNIYNYRQVQSKYPRIQRDGKPYERLNFEASNPEPHSILIKDAENTAAAYGHHPAFVGSLVHTEIRDASNPSFSGVEEKAYKEYSGVDIPSEVSTRNAPSYRNIPDFPTMRVIPDDYPLLKYYSWWWRIGDGWNPLHSKISKALHKGTSDKFWTFYDPAVRVPPQWGSGGDVDCISQWSYTNAAPIKVGQTTDEMLAMSGGNPDQMVMKMTQLFWKRNEVAPANQEVKNPPQWLKEYEDANYISASPDHLQIALWSKIARKLDGIMYHGYSALVEPTGHQYKFTNPECAVMLKDLTQNVIKPLGPLLKQIPERRPEMAILQSFATTVFAPENASFGWGRTWNADIHLALQWAQYQPAIIYEEHIMDGILDQVDVLVLPGIEVLTESVFSAIQKFQNQGGIVIGDNLLVPGIMPDIIVSAIHRAYGDPLGTKTKLQALGADIRKQLNPHFRSPCESDNPDIVPRIRTWKNSDYLFTINDKRTFGDYVGQWGRVMEKGLPTEGEITLNRKAGAVYDLTSNRQIDFKSTGDNCIIPVKLKAGAGNLFLITENPFGEMTVNHSNQAILGKTIKVDVKINDDKGKISETLVPLEVKFLNPKNEVMPDGGYFCAEDGEIKIDFTPSLNELPGNWQIVVKNLADGRTTNSKLSVKK